MNDPNASATLTEAQKTTPAGAENPVAAAPPDPVQRAERALEQAIAAKAPPPALTAADIDAAFAAWLGASVAGGPIARQTDCWNALQAALPALKAALVPAAAQVPITQAAQA